jgi:putative transposase
MISLEHRQHTVDLIDEAVASGARSLGACEEAGIARCTYRRWQHLGQVVEDQRPTAKRPKPRNKLSSQERDRLLSVFHLPAFQSLPPGGACVG